LPLGFFFFFQIISLDLVYLLP